MIGTLRERGAGRRVETHGRVMLLKAVADPTRLAVVDVLAAAGSRCHCDLEEELAVTPSRLSFHMRILREAGLVTTRREGRRVAYELDPEGLRALRATLPAATDEVPA